ncbi:MAG: hypothetical protein ACLUQ0_01710 [Enterococcus italicus]|uniref:hypothetical protein n=1 Tax=Enterococcus italicus TaxID=246144 RepID=UPI003994ED67
MNLKNELAKIKKNIDVPPIEKQLCSRTCASLSDDILLGIISGDEASLKAYYKRYNEIKRGIYHEPTE